MNERMLSPILFLLCCTLVLGHNALAQNCPPPPLDAYYLSDAQIELYNYWQLGAATFACVLIAGNFASAYVFYKKQERNLAQTLKGLIRETKNDCVKLTNRRRDYQKIVDRIFRRNGSIDEES